MPTAKMTLNPVNGQLKICLQDGTRLDDPIISTKRRITSGEELKHRNGHCGLGLRERLIRTC
jgi:hypothetical protein